MAKYLLSFCCLICWFAANANETEIQHLIDFVKNTPCTYVRNGSEYSGKEAVEHIQRKYRYFEDEIQTTEDFIRLSATQSTMSGKAYQVRCNGQTQPSAQWLLEELARFRKSQSVTH